MWVLNSTTSRKSFQWIPKRYAATSKNIPLDISAQRRFKSVCTFAQSDQNPHWVHFGLPNMQSFFMWTMKAWIWLHSIESSLDPHVKTEVTVTVQVADWLVLQTSDYEVQGSGPTSKFSLWLYIASLHWVFLYHPSIMYRYNLYNVVRNTNS